MPAFCDWVGMVEGNGSMYLARPRVAEKVTGEHTTLEEMGGARMHAEVSGCGDEVFDDDWEALAAARLLLTYLPDDFRGAAARAPSPSPPERDRLGRAGARATRTPPTTSATVIDRLVDGGTFFEIKARLGPGDRGRASPGCDGRVVGLVANQPQVRSGAIFVDSADKAARFIALCDAFNVPLLFLQDVPGLHGRRRGRARRGSSATAPR